MIEHVYYAVEPCIGARIPQDGITYLDLFSNPYYEAEIDRMIYGVIIYDHPLTPAEIAGSGLVSLPKDCDSDFSDFANRLKSLREIKGLSQSDLANRIGVSRSTICNYEKGRRNNITTPVLRAIAKALDVDVNDLKGGY